MTSDSGRCQNKVFIPTEGNHVENRGAELLVESIFRTFSYSLYHSTLCICCELTFFFYCGWQLNSICTYCIYSYCIKSKAIWRKAAAGCRQDQQRLIARQHSRWTQNFFQLQYKCEICIKCPASSNKSCLKIFFPLLISLISEYVSVIGDYITASGRSAQIKPLWWYEFLFSDKSPALRDVGIVVNAT